MKKFTAYDNGNNRVIYEFSNENSGKKRYINVSQRNPFGFYVEFFRAKKDKEPQRTFVRFTDIPKMIDALLDIHKTFINSKKSKDDCGNQGVQPV